MERQIGSLYYERLLLSQDKAAVTAEAKAKANLSALEQSPRAFVRDPVMLEFLGLPNTGLLEATLETALMDKLQQFLMELGKGFAFVARQQRISTQTQDFYIDLVFYNYLLKCFVLIDLKTGPLTHQDVGQMPEHIDKIIDTYQFCKEEPRYSRRVGMEEIEKNDVNLNISRYVSTAEAEEEIDLAAVHAELVSLEQKRKAALDKHNAFLKELGLPTLP